MFCNCVISKVIAWVAKVFGINSMSNAIEIVRGEAEYLLLYECY